MEPPGDGGTEVWPNGLGHMTQMAVMRIFGKNLKNHLLWNQTSDDFENWYSALGTQVLPSLFNCPILRQGQILVPYAFVWEKGKTMDFFQKLL